MMSTIEVVLAWDLPDAVLADAFRAQVGAMAGAGAE
jgi:hypothetical protein